jgi:AcrR family transcriptional regulator
MALRGPYQKGKIRRREILLAAIEVFSRRGYRSASIREIAESVGLTQAGLLHYFNSKEELFVEVLKVREELGFAQDDDVFEVLRLGILHNAEVEGLVHLFVTVSADAISDDHSGNDYFRVRYDNLVETIRKRISGGQKAGHIKAGIDPLETARMLVSVADGIQIQWLLDPDKIDMVGVYDSFCRQLMGEDYARRIDAEAMAE